MSFDAHEVFSFDSFFQQLLFWDDFEGDALKDLWTVAGTGTIAVVDAETGGVIRVATGAGSGNNLTLSWNDIRSLHINKNLAVEFRMKLNQITLMDIEIWIRFDANDQIRLRFDTTVDANWHIETVDGGAPTNEDTGVAADTDYHVFRVETLDTPSAALYIDDVLTNTITTTIPDDAGDFLQPAIFLLTRENATKSVDVDYIYARQER